MAVSRRMLFGMMIGGAAAGAWGVAEACSIAASNCGTDKRILKAAGSVLRVQVLEARVLPRSENQSSEDYSTASEIKASVLEVISGGEQPPTLTFMASALDCNGILLGYVPEKGERVIVYFSRDREPDGAPIVQSITPEREFERLARRCRF